MDEEANAVTDAAMGEERENEMDKDDWRERARADEEDGVRPVGVRPLEAAEPVEGRLT